MIWKGLWWLLCLLHIFGCWFPLILLWKVLYQPLVFIILLLRRPFCIFEFFFKTLNKLWTSFWFCGMNRTSKMAMFFVHCVILSFFRLAETVLNEALIYKGPALNLTSIRIKWVILEVFSIRFVFTSAAGTATCSSGYYCPLGSSAMVPCDSGNYCGTTGLSATSGLCTAGYYCY